jgi:hypothetical protein
MNDIWDQRLTLLIEASVSIYLYGLLSLTDFMGVNAGREEIGWLLVIITGTIVVINLSVFFCRSIRRAILFIKPRLQACFFNQKARIDQYKEEAPEESRVNYLA